MGNQQTQIEIEMNDGIAQYEEYLKTLDASHENSLTLKSDIREAGTLGRSAALTQYILTWARSNKVPRIKIYPKLDDHDNYTKFAARLHGLAAAYLSDQVYPNNSKQDIRYEILAAASSRIDAMRKFDLGHTSQGPRIEFVFVQGAKQEFHRSFYQRTPRIADLHDRQKHGRLVASHSKMNKLLITCLRHLHILDRQGPLSKHVDSTNQSFGKLLHETFRNTAEHAYLDPNGFFYDKQIRSVIITPHLVERNQFTCSNVLSVEREEANVYFDKISNLKGAYQRMHIRFLELSVFDSGPGFASTIPNKKHPSDNDVDLVARCFEKHQSAKLGNASGLGLNRVLRIIEDLNGFVRFRTSTAEAFFRIWR